MPEQEVIGTASSSDTAYWDSPRDGGSLSPLSLPLPVGGSTPLCVQSVDQRSQSAEPVIIEAAEGAEPLPPPTQIRLQKNTVFIQDLCKLWRRVSLSLSFLSFVGLLSSDRGLLTSDWRGLQGLHVNRAGWRGVWCAHMRDRSYTNFSRAGIWFSWSGNECSLKGRVWMMMGLHRSPRE